ncbi:MAG: TonB-dependent receptor [Proteobacteria bacterium]|nr:TonB-dependent receptor [Pseudomonadota bacterium]
MKKDSKIIKVFVLLILFILNMPGAVFGETKPSESEKTVTLEEVVVTATRDREEIRKVPAHVSVITEDEIKKSGATTVVELLDKLEGIYVRSYSGNPAQSIIDMRGFGGENPFGKTLIMLDGRRMNRPDMSGINWLQVPINMIERIEVVRGPGSVLYGDAAIGGVVNIITKKGEGPPKFNASFLAGSYGLHNERIGVSGAADKWSYALTGENNFSFGYRDRSKLSSQGGGFDLGYNASDFLNLSLGASFNKTDYQLPGALTKAQMEQNRRQYQPGAPDDEGSDKYTNVNLGIKSSLGAFGQLDINVLYGKKELKPDMASWLSFSNVDIDTYGLTPKYILAKDIFGFRNKLTLGIDWYHEPFKQTKFSTRERTTRNSVTDLTKDSIAWYIRNEFSILDPLILSLGFRQDRTSVKGTNTDYTGGGTDWDDEKVHHADAYEVGLTYLIGKASNVYAKYATVYRIPFLDEQASYYGWGDFFNRSLEKETGKSLEVGAQISPVVGLKMGVSMFRIDMEDEIAWDGVLSKNVNLDKTRHDGAEISVSYKLRDWARFYGNFTYHMATFEEGANKNKEVPLVPNHMANAGVEFFLPYNLTLRPEMRHVSDAFVSSDTDNNAEKLDAYTFYNLYLFYKPSIGKVKITAFFGVENLTDVKYSSFGMEWWGANVYYPMPGITYKGGLSFEF